MGYPVETSFDTSGENIQRRELYPMNEFAEAEPPGGTIWTLFKTWKALSLGGRIPLAQDVLTDNTNTIALDGQTTLVDVGDPNPANFVFMSHWQSSYPRLGSELANTRVGQYPCRMHAKALMSEYLMTRENAEPVYHEIEQLIFGISRHYRRLILPLTDAENRVTKLIVGVRPIRPAVQIAASQENSLMN
ncbi:MAG: hypothetical protein OEU46_16295 [Alphaproteobacteria bacterium]|nr:hypothetical protein [Alphaproteobacteria bacterium]